MALSLETIADVRVTIHALLGQTQATLREVMDFRPGTVVSLHTPLDATVPLLVNGVEVASGDIVTLPSGALALEIVEVTSSPGAAGVP
ncbi:MAG: FliM/FliN family flagellar motor C-terminal domain-containing protein [Candidatus Eremiobacteraeota bacterium]|nr:FliM/FliN family flagellar motor C-terminal domain-containing protein [Candidatus Eremiobacteraeota bacterium]